jgi:DNA repair exonuclease SbcCD ATPase subunit
MLAGLYPPPEPYTLEQEQGAASVLKRAQEIRAAHKTHFDVTHSKISELQKSVDTAQVALRLAIDTCPACKRKFENAAEMQKHREETESAIHDLSQNIYRMKMELKERPDRVVDAERAEIEASKIQLARANWLGQIEAHEKTRATLQASIDAAESELATLKTRGAELKARHLALASEVGELELCVRVLGTRGARVLYLTEAVEQIEALANEYLLDLSPPGIQIKIHTQTLKKGGGYSDTLSIETVGDCGKSYDALSGGQRRRVDVALLLALADMSAAMSGVKGATLFFDEVFDALDSDGCEAVARLLERISKDRAVVLITHNKLLLETVKLTDYIRL